VGGVITYNPAADTYRLPREHAAFMTRASTPNNIAVYAQYMPVLGAVEDEIVDCFRRGGGVPYSSFQRFHDVMAEDSGQTVLPVLLEQILPLAPGVNEALKAGIEVMEIGCGQGRALRLLARNFPKSFFLGYDLSSEAVQAARAGAEEGGLTNVEFQVKDLTHFEPAKQYDLILAFDAVHDQARPDSVLAQTAKALKPTGTFLMQDIAGSSYLHRNLDHPVGPFLYTISCLHCMTVSLAQEGMGLGTMWGEETAKEMLAAAGFGSVEVKRLPHDFQNCYYIVRKQD
jgi:2-polyprenyl-3-methyl-5-hydroxy-6-metoxy-1,4-benzoquinol methylase